LQYKLLINQTIAGMIPDLYELAECEIYPLTGLGIWEGNVLESFPHPTATTTNKSTASCSNYGNLKIDTLHEFYGLNKIFRQFDFVVENNTNLPNLQKLRPYNAALVEINLPLLFRF